MGEDADTAKPATDEWAPDWVSPPGDSIRDILITRFQVADDPKELAAALHGYLGGKHWTGTPPPSIDDATMLLAGTLPINEPLANRIAESFGGTASFWLSRERQYRKVLAEREVKESSWTEQSGKWACSTDEESFMCPETFDTREEALAYALDVLAYEEDVDDGGHVYTGQVRPVKADQVANVFDVGDLMERVEEHVIELVGDNVAYETRRTSPAQQKALEEQLSKVLAEWLTVTRAMPSVCTIDNMKSHVYHRCTAERDGAECTRHKSHDGEHDF